MTTSNVTQFQSKTRKIRLKSSQIPQSEKKRTVIRGKKMRTKLVSRIVFLQTIVRYKMATLIKNT